ncbi:ParA family protein [Wenjunlia tyrosinilytica]|uniref:Chromosome partitioning protein ParA n=1 Tax=Wenjunlia tyrosinilytica TaxID=1544741 RepID=A0A918E203_9ACTN|nr:AAA family ATPase [Wenjunlia tyrosinilytica]GGO97987.1 chromosome partitioning protein ParA [Wenjunlia tyrosinilytica]
MPRQTMPAAPAGPLVVAFMNQAGGARKTTSAVTLGTLLAQQGRRILLVDADSQADASLLLGYGVPDQQDRDRVEAAQARLDKMTDIHDVLLGEASLTEAVVPGRTRVGPGDGDDAFAVVPGLDLVLGSRKMTQADAELVQDETGFFWLRDALEEDLPADSYDAVFIDCRASLGRLEVSILVGSDKVIACTKPESKDLRGVAELEKTIERTRHKFRRLGGAAELWHVLISGARSHRAQGAVYQDMVKRAQKRYGDQLLPLVHNSVLAIESYDAQEPLPFWAPGSGIVQDYEKIVPLLDLNAR